MEALACFFFIGFLYFQQQEFGMMQLIGSLYVISVNTMIWGAQFLELDRPEIPRVRGSRYAVYAWLEHD